MRKILSILLMSALSLFLQGCDQLGLSQYDVVAPVDGGVYIGTQLKPPVIDNGYDKLPLEFKVTYDSAPTSDLQIVLNGIAIGEYFVYTPTEAIGNIESFKQYFRQGKNTLSVDILGFGPIVTFDVDIEGPTIIITRGEVTVSVDSGFDRQLYDLAGNPSSTEDILNPETLEVEGFLRDFSSPASAMEMDVVQVAGYGGNGSLIRSIDSTVFIDVQSDGTFCACDETIGGVDLDGDGDVEDTSISVSGVVQPSESPSPSGMMYSFRAEDINGYPSEKEYLADSGKDVDALAIENAVRVAVGQTFVQSIKAYLGGGYRQHFS